MIETISTWIWAISAPQTNQKSACDKLITCLLVQSKWIWINSSRIENWILKYSFAPFVINGALAKITNEFSLILATKITATDVYHVQIVILRHICSQSPIFQISHEIHKFTFFCVALCAPSSRLFIFQLFSEFQYLYGKTQVMSPPFQAIHWHTVVASKSHAHIYTRLLQNFSHILSVKMLMLSYFGEGKHKHQQQSIPMTESALRPLKWVFCLLLNSVRIYFTTQKKRCNEQFLCRLHGVRALISLLYNKRKRTQLNGEERVLRERAQVFISDSVCME